MDRESINIILPKKNNWLTWVFALSTLLFIWLWINKPTEQIDTSSFEEAIEIRNVIIDSVKKEMAVLQAEIDSLTKTVYEQDEEPPIIYLADTTLDGKIRFFAERYRSRRK